MWLAATRSRWLHSVAWKGSIPVQVMGSASAERTATLDVDRTLAVLRRAAAEQGLPLMSPAVRQALRCPACGSRLQDGDGMLNCEGCERKHPKVGGIPVLLA